MSICGRCKGKGYYWVSNGPDDCDKEYCDYCDGTGKESMPERPQPGTDEPEHIADIIPDVMANIPKGGDDHAFEVLMELTNEQNDALSNITYLADGVRGSYTYKGKQYEITVKPER